MLSSLPRFLVFCSLAGAVYAGGNGWGNEGQPHPDYRYEYGQEHGGHGPAEHGDKPWQALAVSTTCTTTPDSWGVPAYPEHGPTTDSRCVYFLDSRLASDALSGCEQILG
jgi:hypothetical protein